MKTPREAAAHAIETWEGLYQDSPVDHGNLIKLADGSIFPPMRSDGRRSSAPAEKRRAMAAKPGSVVIGTMRGVTPDVLARFKNLAPEALTPAIMKATTLEDAVAIWEASYYRGPGFDRLKWCAAVEVFTDIGWGSGPVTAVKMLQRLVGAHPDGMIGPRTVELFNEWVEGREPAGAVTAIADVRVRFYESIVAKDPSQRKWLTGWRRRANYYRPTNAIWWSTWTESEDVSRPPKPPIEQAEPPARPVEPTPEDAIRREDQTQQMVQAGTIAGGAMTGLASIFKLIPPWAVGALVVGLVVVGGLWALKSLGIIKRSV